MKRMKLLTVLYIIATGAVMLSCNKENFDLSEVDRIPNLGEDRWVPTAIDRWIASEYTAPFNIAIKYKWNQFEADLDKTLVPPKESSIIPIMSAIKRVWIEPYVAESSNNFLRQYAPKFFYLVGSVAYESNGAVKLGQAEGGRKILLYDFNNTRVKGMPGFVLRDSIGVKRMFQTIHHEFGHILHQNIRYSIDFLNINPEHYTADWINYTDAEARRDGFITAYSMNTIDDDFVEMIAIMLIEGKAGYERRISAIPDGTTDRGITQAQAIARLRAKESIVVGYFKDVWNIDFYSLQIRSRAAIETLIY